MPPYASAFCEKMKALQVKCYADDYDACIDLEKSPSLPEGMPKFTYGLLDRMILKLRSARESSTKASAAKKVGSMILECMNDATKCDCSFAPAGAMKSFC